MYLILFSFFYQQSQVQKKTCFVSVFFTDQNIMLTEYNLTKCYIKSQLRKRVKERLWSLYTF